MKNAGYILDFYQADHSTETLTTYHEQKYYNYNKHRKYIFAK